MQGVLLFVFVTFGTGQISFDKQPKINDANSLQNNDKSSSSFSNVFKNQIKSKQSISFGSKPLSKDIATKDFSLAELLNKEAPQPQLETRFGFGSQVSRGWPLMMMIILTSDL